MRALAALLCLAAALGFGALAAAPWLFDPALTHVAQEPGGPPEAAGRPAAPAAAADPATVDLAPLAARPLFSAARRPPPPEAPGAPLEDPNADLLFRRYEVAGVVMLGDAALAMLRDVKRDRLIRLRAGDEVETDGGPAEVTAITLDRLTFRRGGATVVAPVRREGAKTE